jgi:thymidylate synthase (FAD)
MKLIKPYYEILKFDSDALQLLELAGRTCYKSEDRITECSAEPFIKRIVHSYKHESVIEHCGATVKFVVDRGVTHELVRHRIASYSQESTRYCNYGKAGDVTFIIPNWASIDEGEYGAPPSTGIHNDYRWGQAMFYAEQVYLELLKNGCTPQEARSVLPNSLKTEIVMTTNFREWRHIFKLRTSKQAHPQMREITIPLLEDFQQRVKVLFDDIEVEK